MQITKILKRKLNGLCFYLKQKKFTPLENENLENQQKSLYIFSKLISPVAIVRLLSKIELIKYLFSFL